MADRKRFEFGARDCSDHIAYVHAYSGWRDAKVQGVGMDYCWDNFLSPQTLEAMHSLRRQFKELIRDSGFLNEDVYTSETYTPSLLLGGVICSGLFPRVAAVLVGIIEVFTPCPPLLLGAPWRSLSSSCMHSQELLFICWAAAKEQCLTF